MKVAVSITKVFETEKMNLTELQYQFDREDRDTSGIDWYDLEPEQEVWSYAILDI